MKRIEAIFESMLWHSRLIIILAVIANVVAAILLVLVGVAAVALTAKAGYQVVVGQLAFDEYYIKAISSVVAAVDVFLIATVLLIFGIGLYELFISRIEQIENDRKSSRVLHVGTLDELKDRLAKVIIMILVVALFKQALEVQVASVEQLVYFSAAILMASLALLALFFYKRTHDKPPDGGEGPPDAG